MLSSLFRIIRELKQRRRANREVDEELQFHLDMETRANIERGLSPADARRRALADLGGVAQTREAVREVRASWIDSTSQDLRFALRVLSRGGAGWAAVGMLALAIGITAAMFTIVDALLLRPVPFKDPEELGFVYMGSERGGRTTVAPTVLHEWRRSGAFAAVEAANSRIVVVSVDGSAATRGMATVSPGVFDLLGGVRPIRGRLFEPSEGAGGTNDRIVISENIWNDVLGRDPAAIGRSIQVDGQTLVVIGVLPSEFRFPRSNTEIWRAARFEDANGERPSAYVRFRTDVPRADTQRRATEIARIADPANDKGKLFLRVEPLAEAVLDSGRYSRRAVQLLAGGVVLVFIILCANVSSLLLARLTTRQREFATRSALGASRVRLVRQALVESGLIGVLAIAAGAGTAWVLVALARTFLPQAFLLGTLNLLDLDLRALAVTSLAGVVATLVAGLLPAWIGTRAEAERSLSACDRGGTETRAAGRLTRTLLIGELALACTLLVGATLLVRSFVNLSKSDRGLAAEGVVVATVSLLPASAFPDETTRTSVTGALDDELRGLPGAQQVAWTYGLPPNDGATSYGEWRPDLPGASAIDMAVDRYWVSSDFFALYEIPLLRGRSFEPTDGSDDVIVGERLAEALWPGLDPLGRGFAFGKERFRVIGVAREIHYPTLEPSRDIPEFYQSFRGAGRYAMAMASIRCAGRCPDAAVIRQRLARTHSSVLVYSVQPLVDSYAEELARPRAAAALGFAFAAIAVLAAAGGLFSVLSYAVGRRRRELGVRSALGASSWQLAQIVVRDGVLVAVAGLSVGALSAWWLARALTSLQYGVTATDPVSCAIVVTLLAVTVAVASWWPARDAMRTDPLTLLRDE